MSSRGPSPREVTKLLVWGRAAGRCQFKNCRKPLDHDLVAGEADFNSAYLAHIVASSPGGKRGDPERSRAFSDNADNIMLMCDPHHRVIDGDKTWQDYPEYLLLEWKREHEDWVETVLSAGPDSRSHILQFSAPIGPNETSVPFDDCVNAILPNRTPAERRATEIKIKGMHFKDDDPTYWSVQTQVLQNAFAKTIAGRFESGEIRHLSVFALAPIPLLIELGRLLSDISEVDVYDRHREPAQWAWPDDGDGVEFFRNQGMDGPKRVALKLSITSDIIDDRVNSAVGGDISIWEIRSNPQKHGVLRRREDLSRYRAIVRSTLDEIKNVHGMDAEVLLFPATPVSYAVEFGRVWQPKAHPPVRIFDQTKDLGFVERLAI